MGNTFKIWKGKLGLPKVFIRVQSFPGIDSMFIKDFALCRFFFFFFSKICKMSISGISGIPEVQEEIDLIL